MSERPKVRGGKVILWTLLIAFVALAVLGFPFGRLFVEFIGLMLLGWLLFLSRVLPQITLNWEIALNAVVTLGLALFGLHRVLCWWRKRGEDAASPWRFAWTVKISVMVLLLFATSIAAVGIVHQIAWLFREPKVIVMTGRSEMIVEMSNLKQVATACRLYAEDHEGRFPAKVSDLIPDVFQDHRLLFTRVRDDEPQQPILYRAGYKTDDSAEHMIVASPRPFESDRGRHRAVAFVDASVKIVPEAEFQELMLRQRPPERGSEAKQ